MINRTWQFTAFIDSTSPNNQTVVFQPVKLFDKQISDAWCAPFILTSLWLITHTCVSGLSHHWFRYWLASLPGPNLLPNRYLRLPPALQWRHYERDGVSNHRRLDYLLNRLFRHRSKKISKLRVTGLCAGNSPVTSPHKGSVTRKMLPSDNVIMGPFTINFFAEANSKEQIKATHHTPFVRGIHRYLMVSLTKGQ